MVEQKKKINPQYQKIYKDLIALKFPSRKKEFDTLLNKKTPLTTIEISHINEKLFGIQNLTESQRLKSYDVQEILKILNYQKYHNITNTELAKHFKLSRTTVTKWRRLYNK